MASNIRIAVDETARGLTIRWLETGLERHVWVDQSTFEQFLASGEYYWNSGIFFWKAATILDALRQNQPHLAAAIARIAAAWPTSKRDEVFHAFHGLIASRGGPR